MQIKRLMSLSICLLLGMVISLPLQSAQNGKMSKQDILKCLEEGYQEAVLKDPSDAFNVDFSVLPGYGNLTRVEKKVGQFIDNGDFPEVEAGSLTAKNIKQICKEICQLGGIAQNPELSTPTFPDVVLKSPNLPEFLTLYMKYMIERSKAIEAILPNKEQVKEIRKQIKDLKDTLFILAKEEFYDFPPGIINKKLDFLFRAVEEGPTSVQNTTAKRPLTPEQFQHILSKWGEIAEQQKGIYKKLYDRNMQFRSRMSNGTSKDEMKFDRGFMESSLLKYLFIFNSVLRKEFNNALPNDFELPKKPERLLQMELEFDIARGVK